MAVLILKIDTATDKKGGRKRTTCACSLLHVVENGAVECLSELAKIRQGMVPLTKEEFDMLLDL